VNAAYWSLVAAGVAAVLALAAAAIADATTHVGRRRRR
jgi:hypothetical protein